MWVTVLVRVVRVCVAMVVRVVVNMRVGVIVGMIMAVGVRIGAMRMRARHRVANVLRF